MKLAFVFIINMTKNLLTISLMSLQLTDPLFDYKRIALSILSVLYFQ